MRTVSVILAFFALAACQGGIYVRDGVTDGDTFYLSTRAMADDDPAYQSWVRYSLARSTCQLEIGGPNPARATSFDCELTARRLMLESWREHKAHSPSLSDPYLDDLLVVQDSGYLDEYVAQSFGQPNWQLPEGLQTGKYRRWKKANLRRHEPKTRITGSWNYASTVLSAQ